MRLGTGNGGAPKRLAILGATGSIGRSTADILDHAGDAFTVESVAGGRDAGALAAMAIRLKARFAAISEESGYRDLKEALAGTGIEAAAGQSGVVEAALRPSDIVVGAIAGAAGVVPTHAAVDAGRTVALANKECLVCAGAPFIRTATRTNATLLPVDSEHNAIFQALGGADPARIEKMILTASGGPFRTWGANRIAAATREEALKHPNWAMGPKVTIDSATLMNKGLELIEAHHLFGVPADKLDVLVHPQSIVHGLVAFSDGSVTAGLAVPDMKVPIAHCLAHPERLTTRARRLDLAEIATLTFERADLERFPALRVAMDALRHGAGLPTVLNAANEIAVAAFLAGRIPFSAIPTIVEAACNAAVADGTAREPATVEDALAVDHIVREKSQALLARWSASGMVTIQ
jgi:1-deoxy-D-xylulose-5-phosphate reductoisomerase